MNVPFFSGSCNVLSAHNSHLHEAQFIPLISSKKAIALNAFIPSARCFSNGTIQEVEDSIASYLALVINWAHYWIDYTKTDKLDGLYSKYRRDEKYIQNSNWKTCRKRPVVGVDRRIILKWTLKIYGGGCSLDVSDS